MAQNGPPIKVKRPDPASSGPNLSTTNTINGHHTANKAHSSAAGRQLRRATAVRLPGGDPDNPGTRYHRPSTGLRASGYRQGYTASLRWVQREFGEHLDEIGRSRLAAILARSEAA
jgi:hypothetical protein